MYRLTIFVLAFCAISQRLVGSVRRGGGLRSGRGNLFFDSYDRPALDEFEESEDGLRGAVLIQPQEVIDVPRIPLERDYEMRDFDAVDTRSNDYSADRFKRSKLSRNFFQDLLQHIQTAFSKWPPGLPTQTQPATEFTYTIDPSVLERHVRPLKNLLMTVEARLCVTILQDEVSGQVVFKGTAGCGIQAVGREILIGYDCFEPAMVLKLILKVLELCDGPSVVTQFKSSGIYLDNYRSKMRREDEEITKCDDRLEFCFHLVNNNSSSPCGSSSHGDSCVDPNCNAEDIVYDCLSIWDQKKLGCANNCGGCKNRKESDVCVDYFGCCKYYADRGYCGRYPKIMKEFCPLSCGYCTPQSCVDERNDCRELQRVGGCERATAFMARYCRKTCKLCGKGMHSRGNEEKNPYVDCSPDEDFRQKYCSWDPDVNP